MCILSFVFTFLYLQYEVFAKEYVCCHYGIPVQTDDPCDEYLDLTTPFMALSDDESDSIDYQCVDLPINAKCGSNRFCETDLTCISGICQLSQQCTENSDCDANMICLEGRCQSLLQGGVCGPNDEWKVCGENFGDCFVCNGRCTQFNGRLQCIAWPRATPTTPFPGPMSCSGARDCRLSDVCLGCLDPNAISPFCDGLCHLEPI